MATQLVTFPAPEWLTKMGSHGATAPAKLAFRCKARPIRHSNKDLRKYPTFLAWIWEGVLAQKAVTLLSAQEKTGKTTLVAEGKQCMPTRNINLTDQLDDFVKRQVSSGRYGNASELIREALRLLEEAEQERQAKLKALRRAARQGFDEIDQGKGIVLKDKAIKPFIAQIQAEVRSRAAKNRG